LSPSSIPRDEARRNLEVPVITRMNGFLVSRLASAHADRSV